MRQMIDPAVLERIGEEFPAYRDDARRLAGLVADAPPTVAVLGKYNHGKSSLLNVLLGERCFAVSDKRETRCNQIEERAGLRWIDTPGLDADSAGEDDRQAIEVATRDADLRLFVHAIDQGELDRGEAELVARLVREQEEQGRAFLLVVSRIDKIPASDRQTVIDAIRRQVPGDRCIAVSAHAWSRGIKEDKPALKALGNIEALKSRAHEAVSVAFASRDAERIRLVTEIAAPVERELARARQKVEDLREFRQLAIENLKSRIGMQVVRLKLEMTVDELGD